MKKSRPHRAVKGRAALLALAALCVWPAATAGNTVPFQTYTLDDPSDGSSLRLFGDRTFLYESRGSSCWMWFDIRGEWSWVPGGIEVRYTVEYDDDRSKVLSESQNADPHRICVFVTDRNGFPVAGLLTSVRDTEENPTGWDGAVCFDREPTAAEEEGVGVLALSTSKPVASKVFALKDPRATLFRVLYDVAPEHVRKQRRCTLEMKDALLEVRKVVGCDFTPGLYGTTDTETPRNDGGPTNDVSGQRPISLPVGLVGQ